MTETTEIYVPALAGLQWQPDGHRFLAPPTEEFWQLYRPAKQSLGDVGIRVERLDDWQVVFTPGVAPSRIEAAIAAAQAAQIEAEPARLARQEDNARWKREYDERLAREHAEKAERHRQRTLELQTAAHATLAKWGEFAVRKIQMAQLAGQSALTRGEQLDLQCLLRDTENKADSRRQRAIDERDLPGGVDWPDDVVVRAVRVLTGADGDHAEEVNERGWSKADSPSGHWCCALLDTEPRLAIAAARHIIGKYQRQLSTAGVL